ncbi:isoleucine--tRNA ligase [Candidatus Gottesmanbacteria bacterium]|nr:isoleucine--tRNA ligase [Candidatus Gottesmanbacteria bacterium]
MMPIDPKPNFPEMEKRILKWWYESGVVKKYLHKNDPAKKKFFFLDGPITANNPMGVHHAWGRTYKDLWQRYFNMKGYRERFQNGFDCQGLWVEVEVEKELGLKNKKDIENLVPGDKKASIDKFVKLCKERVVKFSSLQTEQSKRLGYFMDWENSYFTNSADNNYMIWYFLKKCHEQGLLYKGHDSVPWCYRCGIAISQHEILTEDYQELTHETVYFKLPLTSKKNTYLLLWTTTPWTIPANVAVAVNSKEKYVEVTHGEEKLILMKSRYETIKNDLQLGEIVKEIPAKNLIGRSYNGPFDDFQIVKKEKNKNPKLFHEVVTGVLRGEELVTTVEGSGLLHVAPGAGEEDFQLGKELGMGVISLIDEDANYIDGFEQFSHQSAKVHPEIIINYLKQKENGRYLLATRKYTHRYPVCWRCKTELVWRVVDEWYIKMSEELRDKMRQIVKNIKWIPGFGLERELDWITNMKDWLISKKRYYGLCLPIYECRHCHTFEVIGSKEELKEKAIEGWKEFEGHSPHRPWVDEVKIACPNCKSVFARIADVGNVWLDAGIVTFSTLVDPKTKKVSYMDDKKYFKEWYPADFITESFPGQFKNWFYSLLVMATVLENHEPFKAVLGFASLLGEDSKPMHKSNKKTFVSFDDGADKIGVDVLRWLYVTHDPSQNLLFGFKIADEVRRKFHLMLWNIYNFYVTYSNLSRNYSSSEARSLEISSRRVRLDSNNKSINILDVWIKARLNQTIEVATKSLDNYDAFTASTAIEKFVNDLSLWYVRRSRDRVAVSNEDNDDKNACLATFHGVLVTLCKLLAPFTPFLAEEMYKNLTDRESVHLENWPNIGSKKLEVGNKKLLQDMETVRIICELGHSKRKELGLKVRQPLRKFLIFNFKFLINEDSARLIKDELNVKEVETLADKGEIRVEFDTEITPELKAEGEARELVRSLQEERKKLGSRIDEYVDLELPSWPEDYTDYIKKETLAKSLKKGEFRVIREKSSQT